MWTQYLLFWSSRLSVSLHKGRLTLHSFPFRPSVTLSPLVLSDYVTVSCGHPTAPYSCKELFLLFTSLWLTNLVCCLFPVGTLMNHFIRMIFLCIFLQSYSSNFLTEINEKFEFIYQKSIFTFYKPSFRVYTSHYLWDTWTRKSLNRIIFLYKWGT